MKILIVAATSAELEPILKKINVREKKEIPLLSFFYKGLEADILITGVGMVATAFQLGKVLATEKYHFALNAGICGCFDKTIRPGEVLHIDQDCFAEEGAEDGEKFLTTEELHLKNDNDFPFSSGMIENKQDPKNPVIHRLAAVRGITVNTVHGNDESIRKIRKRLDPQVESMEGGAFLYSCLMSHIPCAQIRSVSNYIEKRNRDNWNIPLAVINLNKKLMDILDFYSETPLEHTS